MFLKFSNISGLICIFCISVVTLMAFYGLIAFNQQGADLALLQDSYFHSILLFSIKQALLSAILSTVFAWPIARALYYCPKLYFKKSFLSLSLLCFVLPTLVLITGFVSLLGRSGIISPFLGEDWNLYGMQGILLAHVYMNLPFAVRAFHNQLQNIPDTSWILARQMKLNRWQKLCVIEWPALRSTISLVFGFITILCFNSFAVVLSLGGGPQSTTLEVAIYQALKYDFNIAEALTLAWTQFFIAGVFFVLLYRSNSVAWLAKDSNKKNSLPQISNTNKAFFTLLYSGAFCFMLLPLLALVPGLIATSYSLKLLANVFEALIMTLVLGSLVASIAMLIAYCIMLPIRSSLEFKKPHIKNTLQWFANHTLIAPAMVLSVGLYILFLPIMDLDALGMIFVVVLNVLMVLPFAIQQIRSRLIQFDHDYLVLSKSLKLSFWKNLSIEWPYIKPAILSTFSLVLLIAMGDVAIFSIFGNDNLKTLPWLIYQYAGSYRINEASFASAVLLGIYFIVLIKIERAQSHA